MALRHLVTTVPVLAALIAASPADTRAATQVGLLSCDLSAGIGLILIEKQSMTCTFRRTGGGTVERYTGTINEYGIELGGVARGHLVWAVAAETQGIPAGALAGTYAGVAADAAFGPGAGASVLIGGTGRAFSLQPISVEGEVGINIAAGVRTIELRPAS
jgi:uncharacterized protein DUF992